MNLGGDCVTSGCVSNLDGADVAGGCWESNGTAGVTANLEGGSLLLLFLTFSRNRLPVLPEFRLFASSLDFTRGLVPNLFLFRCKEDGISGCGGGPRLNVGFGLVWNGGGFSGIEGWLKFGFGRKDLEGLGVSGSIKVSGGKVKGGEVELGKLLNLFLDPGELKTCGWGVAGLLDGPGLKLKLRGDSVVNIPWGVGLRGCWGM